MCHDLSDNNAASGAFFTIGIDTSITANKRSRLPIFQRFDNQFSLFAYAINGNDILQKVEDGDTLISAKVILFMSIIV